MKNEDRQLSLFNLLCIHSTFLVPLVNSLIEKAALQKVS